jgi:glutathione S-transferase
MKLYVLPWGLYPRRVTICLKGKAISDKFEITPVEITRDDMSAPEGIPPGTVPILDIGNGKHIFQLSVILKYLQYKFPHAPDMRGTTLEAPARVRELMDLMHQAYSFLGTYMRNASKLMECLEPQSEETARVLLDKCHKGQSTLDELADLISPMLADSTSNPTIVDYGVMAYFSVLRPRILSRPPERSSEIVETLTEPFSGTKARR